MAEELREESPGRVLVVDDTPANRDGLKNLLELSGYTVDTAVHGREAVDRVTSDPPDVVIMDVCMPVMNGFDACRLIKSQHTTSHVPVLLLTGLRDRDSRLQGVDAGVIRRVVTNLVANAVKFTPTNGKIRVVMDKPDSKRVVFSVSDEGPGIPEEYHEKIFEKFARVKSETQGRVPSTGLGPTFCKLGVEAHGGRILVESSEGKGSTFKVEIPVS